MILSDKVEPINAPGTCIYVVEPIDGVRSMKPICSWKYETLLNPEKFKEYLPKTKIKTPKKDSKVKNIKNKKAIKLSNEIDEFLKNMAKPTFKITKIQF